MVAGIPKISFALNLFMHITLICQCHFEISKLYQIFKGFISYLCVICRSAFSRRNVRTERLPSQCLFLDQPHYWQLKEASVFFFTVLCFSPLNYHHQTRRYLSQLQSLQVISALCNGYSKLQINSNDNKTSPCFRLFWIWNVSNISLLGLYRRLHLNIRSLT